MNAYRHRRHCLTAFSALSLLLFPALSQAATRKVPSQFLTIQAAINAAAPGDTVLVANGTYTGNGNRDLDFFGKGLTVKSENGPTVTLIDAQGTAAAPHRGFYVHGGEDVVVINGFTVKNGYVNGVSGGGASVKCGVSATVTNCVFSNNVVSGVASDGAGGGGLFVNGGDSSVTVTNCTFTNNTANNGGGGAIIFSDSTTGTTTIANCTFSGNVAKSGAGGGTGVNGDIVTMTGCVFSGNRAVSGDNGGGGGGAFVYATESATVTGCAFSGNTANGNAVSDAVGGGAFIYGSTATVTNCTFSGNAANIANGGGGAYVSSDTDSTVTNCTFSGNAVNGAAATGPTGGGAALIYSSGVETVKNCIAWGDTASTGKEFYFYDDDASSVSLTYTDVQGGAASILTTKGGFASPGNINADPKFVNAATGDFHLQATSPGIGKGTFSGAPAADKDGTARPNPPSMGAYDVVFSLAFTLNATAVYGGESPIGTIALSRPAPTGGTLVALSSNTGYAGVPVSVTVPVGATSATFRVTTAAVTGTKAATITARSGSLVKTASVVIYPPDLKSLALSPTRVKGGKQNSVGTVTLTSAAPSGGLVVALSSNTGYAIVPSSVVVPAGSKTATFTVTTKPVTGDKGAVITAVKGAASKPVGLVLTP